MAFHVMLIPTLSCPANCSYCWSSEERSPIMSIETIKEVVEWLKDFRRSCYLYFPWRERSGGADFYQGGVSPAG